MYKGLPDTLVFYRLKKVRCIHYKINFVKIADNLLAYTIQIISKQKWKTRSYPENNL